MRIVILPTVVLCLLLICSCSRNQTQNNNSLNSSSSTITEDSNANKTVAGLTRHSIKGVQSLRCLDIADKSTQQEARLQIWECTPENLNQKFDITLESDGYKMRLAHTSDMQCLEVAENGLDDEKPLQQKSCNDGDPVERASQRWRVQPIGGAYQIVNVRSGKCIDVWHESTGNMSRVNQHECLPNQMNQRFTFEPALPPPPAPPSPSTPTPTPTPTPIPIEKNKICFDKPIPAGWILIDRQQGHLEGCPNTERFNIQEIQRIDNRPAGEMLIACLGNVPAGWELLGKNIDRTKCGWTNGTANNIMNIRKK